MDNLHWVHELTDTHYKILDFAIDENTMVPVVIYSKTGQRNYWVRPCSEFFDGRFRPFKPKSRPKALRLEDPDNAGTDNIFTEDGPDADTLHFNSERDQVARRDTVAMHPDD